MVLPETKAWADEILREREALWNGQAHIHGENWKEGDYSEDTKQMQDEYYTEGASDKA